MSLKRDRPIEDSLPESIRSFSEDRKAFSEDRTSSAIDSLRRTLDLLDAAIDRLSREEESADDAPVPRPVTAVPMPAPRGTETAFPSSSSASRMPSEAMAEAVWRALEAPRPSLENQPQSQPIASPKTPMAAETNSKTAPTLAATGRAKSESLGPVAIDPSDADLDDSSLTQLGRKLEDIEAVLDAWRPRTERRLDSPSQRLTRHFDDRMISPHLGSQRIGFRSHVHLAVQRLRGTERQILLLLVANLGVFLGTALATGWSLSLGVPSQATHLLAIGVIMQIATLFGLAWFVSQTRSIVDLIDDSEHEYAALWRRASSERLMNHATSSRKDGPSSPEPYGWNESAEEDHVSRAAHRSTTVGRR